LRLTDSSLDPQAIYTQFRQEGIPLQHIPELPVAFRVERRHVKQISLTREFQRGQVMFHDLASMHACLSVDPQPGEQILDACAAPFMKSQLLHFLSKGNAQIFSAEVSLQRWRQSPKFPGYGDNLTIINADASSLPVRLDPSDVKFDKIILDPPCTSSGAIYYNPADKWRQTPEFLAQHVTLQQNLLRECIKYLKSSGKLVYCVCSIYPEEGEKIITAAEEDLVIIKSRRFFPHTDKCQGFFTAILAKKP
jgi:16S rRNA (cytosine967-C5)-methyltransferase